MNLKILAIDGSHRDGNSKFMLNIILNAARSVGAGIEHIELRKKNITFCNGGDDCCPKALKCHLKDDMAAIYSKLEAADTVILASPSYFNNVTARMKNFMDRCNPYWFNKKLTGKKAFLVGVGGAGEKSIKEMLNVMRAFVRILGMEETGFYYIIADKAGELEGNEKVIKELQDIGKKLAEIENNKTC